MSADAPPPPPKCDRWNPVPSVELGLGVRNKKPLPNAGDGRPKPFYITTAIYYANGPG